MTTPLTQPPTFPTFPVPGNHTPVTLTMQLPEEERPTPVSADFPLPSISSITDPKTNSCECGIAVWTENAGDQWIECPVCNVFVGRNVVIGCDCGYLEHPVVEGFVHLEGLFTCPTCKISSHNDCAGTTMADVRCTRCSVTAKRVVTTAFECTSCDFTAGREVSVQKHVQLAHPPIWKIGGKNVSKISRTDGVRCRYCKKSFNNFKIRNTHFKFVHPNKITEDVSGEEEEEEVVLSSGEIGEVQPDAEQAQLPVSICSHNDSSNTCRIVSSTDMPPPPQRPAKRAREQDDSDSLQPQRPQPVAPVVAVVAPLPPIVVPASRFSWSEIRQTCAALPEETPLDEALKLSVNRPTEELDDYITTLTEHDINTAGDIRSLCPTIRARVARKIGSAIVVNALMAIAGEE